MDIAWVTCALGLAGVSAYITCRYFFQSLRLPTNILIGLVLFVVFQLLPVHLAATLELLGVTESVSLARIVLSGCLALLGLLMYARHDRHVPSGISQPTSLLHALRELPKYLQAAILVVVATYILFAINLLTSYPTGADTLSYHLPVPVRWLQDQSLRIPPSGAWKYSLPGNAEIGMMLMLASGYQSLAPLFNMIPFLIAACSIYLIAFRVVNNSLPALLTVVLFASIPIVQFQAFSGYVDLYGSSFLLAGIAIFLFRSEPPQNMARSKWYSLTVVLSGCAWGIAVGTKPTFYLYAGVCFLSALVFIWAERKEHDCSALLVVTLMTLSMLLPSLHWFLRALVQTGNPVYPFQVEIFGRTIFDGLLTEDITATNYYLKFGRSNIEWLFYPWVEYKQGYSYCFNSGIGAVWATFVPLGLIYGVYKVARDIKNKNFRLYSILMVSLLIMSVIWWFCLRRVPRFGLPLFALACILTAPLFDLLIRRQLRIFRCLIICSIITTCTISAFIPTHSLLKRIRTDTWQRAEVYRYPPLLDQLPKGAVVWNLGGSTKSFPLAGKHLSNRVIPHNWAGRQSAPEFIRREEIDYIVDTYPFSPEDIEETGAHLIFEGKVCNSDRPEDYWRVWEVADVP